MMATEEQKTGVPANDPGPRHLGAAKDYLHSALRAIEDDRIGSALTALTEAEYCLGLHIAHEAKK